MCFGGAGVWGLLASECADGQLWSWRAGDRQLHLGASG